MLLIVIMSDAVARKGEVCMRVRLISTAVLLLLGGGFSTLVLAFGDCQKFPSDRAAVIEDHGYFFFIYPRTISANFSGCQTMWDENGKQLFVLTFEQGNLISYESNDPSGKEKNQTCLYKHGKLAQHGPTDCPDYGDVKKGLQSLPQSDEPIVPAERDPRK
ncbi:hypothetical protein [Massilia sp. Root418]|uniref:hypothetical protein n=1 Tax=Massilia sp. Root418 TaxID=1736532 RepID=UPI0012F6A3A7|nr:hypothetical protein [Massilia sp. Root418]